MSPIRENRAGSKKINGAFPGGPVRRALILGAAACAGGLGVLAAAGWADPTALLPRLEYGTLAYGWTLAVLTLLRLRRGGGSLCRFPRGFAAVLAGFTLVVMGNAAAPVPDGRHLPLLWAGAVLMALGVLRLLRSRRASARP